MEWLRDGNMLYTLEHAGWDKGQEKLRNRIYISVQAHKDVPTDEIEKLTFAMQKFLNDSDNG